MNVKLAAVTAFFVSATIISCQNSGNEASKGGANQNFLTSEQRQILQDDSLEKAMYSEDEDFDDTIDILTSRKNIKKPKPDTFGMKVKYNSVAKPCIDTFQKVMKLYGIDEQSTGSMPTQPPKSLRITSFEVFRGKELKQFIRYAANKRPGIIGRKKKLAVRVEFGIYTRKVADSLMKPERYGRICAFLVTRLYEKSKKKKWKLIDDDPTEDVDDYSFDFGGIHP
jgi:hypothetical protein